MKQKLIFALVIGLFLINSCSRYCVINGRCDEIEARLTGDASGEKLYHGLIDHIWFVCTVPLVIRQERRKKVRRRVIFRSSKCKLIFGKSFFVYIRKKAGFVCLQFNLS